MIAEKGSTMCVLNMRSNAKSVHDPFIKSIVFIIFHVFLNIGPVWKSNAKALLGPFMKSIVIYYFSRFANYSWSFGGSFC